MNRNTQPEFVEIRCSPRTKSYQATLVHALYLGLLISVGSQAVGKDPPPLSTQPSNVWMKQSPLPDGPASPRLGYEGACVWDSWRQLVVRYGGHNQGGGGEQGAEVWTYDVVTTKWTLRQPNTSPPGVCCNAQNVFDPTRGRYIRFPKFSGSHGWQWWREIYLNDSSVWTFDLENDRWRNMRPMPTPRLAPYRSASWDHDEQVVVVFGGEGSQEGTLIYDPARNEWRWPKPALEPAPRSGGSMAYDASNKLHILLGTQFTDDPHTWAYSVTENVWRDLKPERMPPTDKNDAVLTYDPLNGRILAIVKLTHGEGENAKHELQTWTFATKENTWTRMNPDSEPAASGNRARNLIFAPELNLAILENCTSKPREQQIWTYRYGQPAEPQAMLERPREAPAIVEDMVVSVLDKRNVDLQWSAPLGLKEAAYHVERAAVEVWSDDQLQRLKANTRPLAMPSVGAIRQVGEFKTLTEIPLQTLSFTDSHLDLTMPHAGDEKPIYEAGLHAAHVDESGRGYPLAVFAYRVRIVDADGNVSGPSPAFFTIPSSPQHVLSRENESTAQVKWAANPEKGIAGYRIYRMDGRWAKDPISRLTAEPISERTFSDASAGTDIRRYYVVAIDALGQEGFPSSPVWYNREWQAFYEPFIGDWHQ
jgi:hypothetical protein